MRPTVKQVVLNADENVEIFGSVAKEFRLVQQAGKLTKLKIQFLDGAVLFVPLSKAMQDLHALVIDDYVAPVARTS